MFFTAVFAGTTSSGRNFRRLAFIMIGVMSGILIAAIVNRPQRRLFRSVGRSSLRPFPVCLPDSCVRYPHGG